MTKEQILAVRSEIDKLDIQVPNEDGVSYTTIKTPIHLFCDTNISQYIDWRDGAFIWDDDREMCIVFSINSNDHMNLTPAMSPGSRPVAPVYVGYLQYDSIISMRAVLVEETFKILMNELHLDAETQKKLYHQFFVQTDQRYVIPRKNSIGYSNQGSKAVEKNRFYDERNEYLKTVHAQSL